MPRVQDVFLAGLLSVCLLSTVCGAEQADTSPALAAWHVDLGVAWQKARTKKLPLLLVATTDQCFHCELLKKQTLDDKHVLSDIRESFIPTTVKDSEQPALMQRLRIRAFPMTVVISPDGQVLDMFPGYVPPQQFRARLATFSSDGSR